MVRQIAPVFFTRDIPAKLAYYTGKLGFECLGTRQDPPVYAIVACDQQVIHFRCAEPPTANPDKYADELLDAYLSVDDADALYAEYAAQGVEFTRGLGNMPWHKVSNGTDFSNYLDCNRIREMTRQDGLAYSLIFCRHLAKFTRH
jgi:catechol 2,3-dioxygenase-like lactoylglutathione lyase family enzyme